MLQTSISCLDVTAVRKHKTAKLIPNAIQIETGEKKVSLMYERELVRESEGSGGGGA